MADHAHLLARACGPGLPWISAGPGSARIKPAKTRMNVDLPAPFGPSSSSRSPRPHLERRLSSSAAVARDCPA